MDYLKESLKLHARWKGKLEVNSKVRVDSREALSLAYSPGVAAPCLEIQKDPEKCYDLTGRANTVAVITDGTAVLGLGDIGPIAGMPVMEGKCVLFSEFGKVNAIPLCVSAKDPDKFVETVALIAGSFGGINLEDISAPRCFEIERKLQTLVDIPVFHDDQHGTAVVVSAALQNALKLTGRKIEDCKFVLCGFGAAGVAITGLLWEMGARNFTAVDREGIVCADAAGDQTRRELALRINPENKTGSLFDAMKGADVFIGVAAGGLITPDMVRSMAKDPILFPLSNPTPEIMPELALASGAAVVGSGRSDYNNQINNVLAFPGIFRGALDVRARCINGEMKKAAAAALAALVSDSELSPDYIIPNAFDPRVVPAVSAAVSQAAYQSGVARI